jgi:hypothetical protein
MALVIANRVQETTTTTGTGTVTLAGAVAGFQSFAVVGNTNTTYYTITSGTAWEVGIGTYSTTGPTLARTTILSSSNANAAITLAGTSSVFSSYPAEKVISDGYGLLPVANGGTGATTLTANGVLYGSGTSAIAATAVGTTGQVLVGNTGAAPSWSTLSGIGVTSFSAGTTGLTPSSATTGVVTLAGTLGVANGGTGTATAFTTGSVVFAGASGVYTQDNANLFWDDTNNRLGIGTTTPAYPLDVTTTGPQIVARLTETTAASTARLYLTCGTATGIFQQYGQSHPTLPSQTTLSSPGALNLSTSGVPQMHVTTGGSVGIGTTAPSTKLHVTRTPLTGATTRPNAVITLEDTASTELYLVSENTGNGQLRFGDTDSNYRGAVTYRHATDHMEFITAASERMRITSAGLVGIGTSSPATKLDVNGAITSSGSTNPYLALNNGTATSYVQVSSGALDVRVGGANPITFNTNATERMRITSAGDIGIGTTSISYKLEVAGDVRIAGGGGDLRIQSATGTTTAGGDSLIYNDVNNMIFTTGTTTAERMRIDASGNASIGTTTGLARLRVAAASAVNAPVLGNVTNYPAFFSNSDVGYGLGIGTSAGDGHVWLQAQRSDSATAYNLTLNEAGGNVGIGTSSPGQKLSVAGTVESTTGGFKFPDGTTQTTAVSANVMELISTASPSAASEVVFTDLTSAYSYYEIVFETTAGYVSRVRLSSNNGSTFLASYYYSNDTIFGTSTVTQTGTSGIGQTYIDLGAASYAGIIQFLYPTSAGSLGSSIQSQTQGLTTSSYRASGRHLSGGNNAIRLYPQTGTVTGTFKLYGVKA